MVDNLTLFLQADELDETQRLAQQVLPLDAEGEALVRSIVHQWQDAQAVANLLLHPTIMPVDIRNDALLRGLHEPLTYNTLASVVGLQNHADWWTNDEKSEIVERLQSIMFSAPPPLANRASVTLLDYVQEQDIDKLIFFLGYPGEIVQHNSLVALVRLIGEDETLERVNAAFEAKQVTEAGQDFTAAHIYTVSEDGLPLLSYIPNLKDYSG